jgi:hypothetical protein
MNKYNIFSKFKEIDNIVQNYSETNLSLLEKYLNQKELKDYIFTEALIKSKDFFNWFVPLYKKNMFKPENNSPKPIKLTGKKGYKIPLWPGLRYLTEIAVENTKKKNKEVEKNLIRIANKIIKYNNIEKIDNSRTDLELLEIIYNISTKFIEKKHVEFIERSLKTKMGNHLFARVLCEKFIPKLIKDQLKDLILDLLEIILSFMEERDKLGREYKSIIEEYIFNDFLDKNKEGIADLCGKEASLIGINKIGEILKKDKHKFDIYSIWTIKDEKQPRSTDSYEYQIIRFVRDIYEHSNPETIKENISILLNKKHSIFKRIAIHVINYHYKKLNDLFWQTWQDSNPLDNYQLKPEIYELFKNNCTLFDKEQIMIIINWINKKDYKEKTKEAKAYRKREWLETLFKTNNEKVLKEYERNKKINPTPITYPGKVIWMDTYWGKDVSPISSEELLEKTNEQIYQYLINFKEEKFLNKPTQEGLEDTLRKSITENPSKYTEDLVPFFKLPLSYHSIILQGLNTAWQESKSFNWENVFDYILAIIDPEIDNYRDFWEAEYEKSHNNYRDSIISEIANLIHEGTRNDNHAFDKKHLLISEKILLLLSKNVKYDLDKIDDLHTRIINSIKYKIFSAMISYSLRYARTKPDLSKEDRWKKEIKDDFTNRLGKETSEFYFTLGQYFLNLNYLNKEWIQKNINKVFQKEEPLRQSFIVGFFAYTNRVYLEIFNLLKENGILLYALNYKFSERHINERIIQHICLAYLEGWEKLEDLSSLIAKILEDKKEYQIAEVVRFVKMFHEKLNGKRKQKIKPLWSRIFNIISENVEKSEFQNIAADLIDWLKLIDKIDEDIFNWLKLSVKYIDQYNPAMVYRKYYEHIDKNPKKIGKLILEMLKYKIPVTYYEDDIEKIVESLYSRNQKEIADEICNIYGKNGYYFLKDTFKRYNKT